MSQAADQYKLTVLLPVYNGAATVGRALESILSQSLDDMEVIIINDGSTDNSFDIINDTLVRYPHRIDSTSVIFHIRNRGVSAANAESIAKARGRYIIRCDADDEFLPGALQAMVDKAESAGADIVIGQYTLVDDRGERVKQAQATFPDINRMKFCVDNYGLWNKLISRRLLLDADIQPVPGVECWEDMVLTARAMAVARRTVRLDRPIYRYYLYKQDKTLSRSPRDKQLRQHIAAAKALEQWFRQKGLETDFAPFLDRLKLIAKVKYLRGRGKDVEAWKSTFPEVNPRILAVSQVPLHYRLMMRAVAALPTGLTQWLADRCDTFYKKY